MKGNSQDSNFRRAKHQDLLPLIPTKIRELITDSKKFNVYPAFQRSEVWPRIYKQALIDTILSSDPFVPVTGWLEEDENNVPVYRITDGHQRLSTMIAFYQDQFKTWTLAQKMNHEPLSAPPIEAGRKFSQMSEYSQQCYLDYTFYIMRTPLESEQTRNIRYLRTQNHLPLTTAEKLKVYLSETKIIAQHVKEHRFWEDLYEGRDNREQPFQSSLQLIALEMAPSVMVDLSSTYMYKLAAGQFDKQIKSMSFDVTQAIFSRLSDICHLYNGLHFTSRGLIIAMYQSSMFLDKVGYNAQSKHKGALTEWLEGIIAEYSRSRKGVSHGLYDSPIHNLHHMVFQQRFWARHYKTVMNLLDIDLTDKSLPILDIA